MISNTVITQSGIVTYSASVTLISSQILSLNTTPITVVTAPTDGTKILVLGATASLTYNSAAYDTHTQLGLITKTGTVAQFTTGGSFLAQTASTSVIFVPSSSSASTQLVANQDLQVQVVSGDPGSGDSSVIVSVLYTYVN